MPALEQMIPLEINNHFPAMDAAAVDSNLDMMSVGMKREGGDK